jgi:hypothetical protein
VIRRPNVAAVAWALVAGLLSMYLVLFGLAAVTRLARPLEELSYGESWLLDGARQVALGKGLYGPPDHVPLMQFAYTPVYYALVGGLQRVFGDSGYTLGRGVSLLATLVGALALGWSIRYLTRSTRFGALAAGLLLTQNVTLLLWGSMERVDALALALTLIGLALYTAERSVPAACVFVLAFFTKQTYVVAPIAAAIALWPCKMRTLRFGSVVLGGITVGVLLGQVLSDGWFWWHVVVSNSNQADLDTFATLVGSFLQFNGVPVLAALATFVLPQAKGERVWRLYVVLSLLTVAAVAKLGASSNYWLETTAATSAALAIAAQRLSTFASVSAVAPTVIAGALLIAVPAYQATATELGDEAFELLRPTSPRYLSLISDVGSSAFRVDAEFVDFVAREPGELLTDNSGLAVAAGKPIEYEFQIFQLLSAEGYWSEQPILEAIAARRFSLVALMHPLDGPIDDTRWSPAIQSALQANYAPAGAQSGFWLYRPRASS